MVKDLSKMFVRGALKVPEAKFLGARFRAAPKFRGPPRLLLSGYCTPVENQGAKPWCAAYSASSYAENILWRVKGYREEIDPAPVYAHAKRIDGDPDGDGTYLECALDALLEQGLFDRNVSKVKTFGGRMFCSDTALDDLKYAVHRYGVCVAGFNITSEWFAPKGDVIRGERSAFQGRARRHGVRLRRDRRPDPQLVGRRLRAQLIRLSVEQGVRRPVHVRGAAHARPRRERRIAVGSYLDGVDDGLAEGKELGYKEGYKAGYDAGFAAGKASVVSKVAAAPAEEKVSAAVAEKKVEVFG